MDILPHMTVLNSKLQLDYSSIARASIDSGHSIKTRITNSIKSSSLRVLVVNKYDMPFQLDINWKPRDNFLKGNKSDFLLARTGKLIENGISVLLGHQSNPKLVLDSLMQRLLI